MGTISLSIQIVRPEEVEMIDVAYVDAGMDIGRYDLGYDSRLYQALLRMGAKGTCIINNVLMYVSKTVIYIST